MFSKKSKVYGIVKKQLKLISYGHFWQNKNNMIGIEPEYPLDKIEKMC